MTAVDLHLHRFEPEDAGARAAAPVLIAHGLFGSGRNWATLAKRFSASRPVATVDMRNHGASPWTDAMDYPLMAADLRRAARAAFGRPAMLVGHSMGGKAAMAATLAEPRPDPDADPGEDGILGVAVVDIAPVDYTGSGSRASGLDGDNARYLHAMRALDLSRVARRSDADAILAETGAPAGIRAFLLQNLIIEPGAVRWRLNLAALEAALPSLFGWPAALAERTAPTPALALKGGASDYVDAAGAEALRAAFPQVQIDAIDGAGHWAHAEKPDAVGARLQVWFETIG